LKIDLHSNLEHRAHLLNTLGYSCPDEFFEFKNRQEGYGRYVLSTRLWLLIEPEEIEECNIKFKQYDTSFKLVQALVDQELPSEVSNQEIQEWESSSLNQRKQSLRLRFIAKRLCLFILW
jgi:hypothetical protein